MCGIAGVYEREAGADLGRLHVMSRLLRHRGPDDEGIVLLDPRDGRALTLGGADTPEDVYASTLPYAPGRRGRVGPGAAPGPDPEGGRPGAGPDARFAVGLMHRRLSIVDLSPAGHQPMCDAGGRLWITYNGEVYNFVELRAELESAGERFVSTSDTEVILAAYRRWGRACLARLNGMFAFALWDADRRELFCARDRFGVKPFYYQWDGRSFAFGSEPEALVLTQKRRIVPRLEAIRDLVALDWVDHERHTFFEGLMSLPPAHFLVVGEEGLVVQRWWELRPGRLAGGPEERARAFEQLFTDAVGLRLRADVEVGSCLSGGLDSSAVVTTAAALAPRALHAFTCAYDEGAPWDERRYVQAVVEATGARAHLAVPDGGDFWETFDRLTVRQSEPTAGPGLYSQWKVMELAHGAGLKVLLDGQGGDETLAGYFRYLPVRLRDLLAGGDPGAFLRLWGPVVRRLGAGTTLALTLEPWLPRALVAPLRRRFGQGKDRVLAPALRALARPDLPKPPRGFPSGLSRQLAFDTLQRLLPSLLRYEDRNSMAFSIETRLPFLDYRLVELAFSLPDTDRLEGATTKAILRRALGGRIPRPVLERRDKMGFETPTDLWLRGRYAGEVRRRLLGWSPLHEWLDPARLAGELEDYLCGRRAIGLQVWRWLSLESWARRYVATDPRVGERPPERILHAGRHRSYVEQVRGLADAGRGS
ncbi:MAG: asparagine synthase (glutamine-hydrolyzing) [Candidatus Eisenbacteria bacterium]|nr:asparagine synthase (glutamine-hydrolyzing) [Candidatus Eisenbacteria bacterium]